MMKYNKTLSATARKPYQTPRATVFRTSGINLLLTISGEIEDIEEGDDGEYGD